MNFIKAYRDWDLPVKTQHPALYLEAADLPGLRKKAKRCKNIWKGILAGCSKAIADPGAESHMQLAFT